MTIPEIKRLVENYSIAQLIAAEEALIDEAAMDIEVNGADEGEQLTHVFAAIYILNKIDDDQVSFKAALRDYTSKVRESIN